MKFRFLVSIIFLNIFIVNANFENKKNTKYFENTQLCQKAYKNIIALKLDSGIYYLEQENKVRPNNNYPVYLYSYIDFLTIFTSGNINYYEKKIKGRFINRVEIIQDTENENSQYFLYIQAEIYLQSAILSILNKDYITSVYQLRKALKKLEANQKKFPKFKENKKSLGLLLSVLGSIPDNLKTGFSLIGLNGDINKGMEMLKILSEDSTFKNQHETTTIYAYLLFHLNNKKEEAWQVLKRNNFFETNSLMDKYTIAHIGIYGFHNTEAIKILENIKKNEDFIPFPFLDYLLGIAKTYRQDNNANLYFKKFLKETEGKDYIKSTYQKMAWNFLLKENYQKYDYYISKIKNNGRLLLDSDKQAQKEISNLNPPNFILLKARLLSDGNYTQEAISLLSNYTLNDFVLQKEKVEFQYRQGRIHHKNKNLNEAINYYLKTIDINNQVEAYYGANACYLIGNIYEAQNNDDKALKYYKKCLTMNGYQYNNSIKQKAKAGVNRLKM